RQEKCARVVARRASSEANPITTYSSARSAAAHSEDSIITRRSWGSSDGTANGEMKANARVELTGGNRGVPNNPAARFIQGRAREILALYPRMTVCLNWRWSHSAAQAINLSPLSAS